MRSFLGRFDLLGGSSGNLRSSSSSFFMLRLSSSRGRFLIESVGTGIESERAFLSWGRERGGEEGNACANEGKICLSLPSVSLWPACEGDDMMGDPATIWISPPDNDDLLKGL